MIDLRVIDQKMIDQEFLINFMYYRSVWGVIVASSHYSSSSLSQSETRCVYHRCTVFELSSIQMLTQIGYRS